MKTTFKVDLNNSAQIKELIQTLNKFNQILTPLVNATGTETSKKTPATGAVKKELTSSKSETISLEALRELTAQAVKDGHRDAVKSKLAELGAPNVSSLPENTFEEYKAFLNEL